MSLQSLHYLFESFFETLDNLFVQVELSSQLSDHSSLSGYLFGSVAVYLHQLEILCMLCDLLFKLRDRL